MALYTSKPIQFLLFQFKYWIHENPFPSEKSLNKNIISSKFCLHVRLEVINSFSVHAFERTHDLYIIVDKVNENQS